MKILLLTAVTLATSACGFSHSQTRHSQAEEKTAAGDEASLIQYHTIGIIADNNWAASKAARDALSDGRLTNEEYDQVIAEDDADTNANYAADKAASLEKWGRK